MSANYLISPETPLRLLFVEDNELNRFLIGKIVKGYQDVFEMAVDGREAVAKVKSSWYDLIFMDINMPVMDGFEAVESIRKLEAPKNSIPIIGMTNDSDRSVSNSPGINDFIAKYFQIQELKSKAMHWVQKKPASDLILEEYVSSIQNSPFYSIKDESTRHKMMLLLIQQKDEYCKRMEEGIQKTDWNMLNFTLHKMRSTLEVMNFPMVKEHLEKMEVLIKEKDLDELVVKQAKTKLILQSYFKAMSALF